MPPTEPIWNQIHAALIDRLKKIRKSEDDLYWYDLRHVFDIPPENVDRTRLPALIVVPLPELSSQVRIDRSITTESQIGFELSVLLKNDPADEISPFIQMGRMIQDIHRCISAEPNLGLDRVRTVSFPQGAEYDPADLTGKQDFVAFSYAVVVEFSFDWNTP